MRLTKGQPKSGHCPPVRSTISPTPTACPSRCRTKHVLPDSLATRHDIFRHDKLLATRNCKGAAQDQAAGLFIGNICRSPNERPTSWPKLIPTSAGEIT